MLSHFFTCHQLESSLLITCGTQTLHQQLVLCQGLCWCCPISSPATSWSRPSWSPVQGVWHCINNWFYVRVCVDAVPFLRLPPVGVVLADHLCNVFDAASTTGFASVPCRVWEPFHKTRLCMHSVVPQGHMLCLVTSYQQWKKNPQKTFPKYCSKNRSGQVHSFQQPVSGKGQRQCKQQQQLSQSGAWRTGHARCILINRLYLERGRSYFYLS